MKVFTREEIDDAMPVLTLRVSLLDQCVVCMGELNEGDSVRVLPCGARAAAPRPSPAHLSPSRVH